MKYFLPPFLHIVLPFLSLMLVFTIIRIACARIFRSSRPLRVLIDSVIVVLFLVVAALMTPIVINTVKLPGAESASSVQQDMTDAYDAYVSAFEDAFAKANPSISAESSEDSSASGE